MSWPRSLRLFTFSGVPVEMHVSFLVFLGYFAWEGWSFGRELAGRFNPLASHIWPSDSLIPRLILQGSPDTWAARTQLWMPWVGLVWFLCILVLMFTCVVLHEFGHIFAARRFGIATHEVTLLPIGGVARMASIPREPVREFAVAIAGPLVNVAIFGALWPFFGFDKGVLFREPVFSFHELGALLVAWNVFMACFNLLPIFPMDGGRVFRAVLGVFFKPLTATRIVLWIAPVVASALIWFLVFRFGFKPWMTAVLLVFVLTGGQMEYGQLKRLEATRGLRLGELLTHDYLVLRPEITVREALALCRRCGQEVYIVHRHDGLRSGWTGGLTMLVWKGRAKMLLEQVELTATSPRDSDTLADHILEIHPRFLPPLIPIYEHGQWIGVVNPGRFDASL